MKKAYGFIEFESIAEFRTWLNKQKVYRTVTRLQVHHMWLPDYSCWEKDNALRRQKNTKDYHIQHNGWDDIAQHFSVYPNGHIVTGRSLNKTPIGIRGWNTNAICVEIYGNFDKGHDKMTAKQKEAVIGLYGELCKKFDIPVNSTHIRPHAWFTAGGTFLGDYSPSRSAKTCPGTNFMGIGNSKAAMTTFIGYVKSYMNGTPTTSTTTSNTVGVYKVIVDELNIRQGPGTSYSVKGVVKKGEAYTITQLSGSWGKLKSGAGWINVNAKYCTKVR